MSDRQIAPFLTAVDRLYAAALNPAEWQPFLAAAAALFAADNAYISQVDDNHHRVLASVALKQLDWQAPCGGAPKPDLKYSLVVSAPERCGVTNYLGLTRDPSGKPFAAAEREVLQDLAPHLDRAFTVRRGLQRSELCDVPRSSILPDDDAARMGIISNPAQARGTANPESIIQSHFGLSPRQTVLTGLLLSGRSVKEAAAALGLTEGTARQYLKLIFSKTGARRQVDLIRVVAKALAPQDLKAS